MKTKQTSTTAKPGGVQIRHVINFGHPLSPEAVATIGDAKVDNIKVDLVLEKPVGPQISKIMDHIKIDVINGTKAGLAIVLPGMSEATAYILASLHGRTGRLPVILPLRRDDSIGVFVVAQEGGQPLEKFRQAERRKRS